MTEPTFDPNDELTADELWAQNAALKQDVTRLRSALRLTLDAFERRGQGWLPEYHTARVALAESLRRAP